MKIWYGYGSEHSMNLVMIGHFKDVGDAGKAKRLIEQIAKQVSSDMDKRLMDMGGRTDRYTDDMLKLLSAANFVSVGPMELEQFAYDFHVKDEGEKLIVTTEEADVSAIIKLFVQHGARVEVFSAHDYPESKYGRGK